METVIEIVEQEINAVRKLTCIAFVTEEIESKSKAYGKHSVYGFTGMCKGKEVKKNSGP